MSERLILDDRNPERVVIIGAGHAGVQAAMALRQAGYAGSVAVLDGDAELPYQRPPLSKAFLKDDDAAPLLLRAPAFYEKHDIELLLGSRAVAIDRAAQRIELDRGAHTAYDHLVLATGARNRELPFELPRDCGAVHGLRTRADAARLRSALRPDARVVIVGGGFIGLEVAAAARERGCAVSAVEVLDRILSRAVSAEISSTLSDLHRVRGVQLITGQSAVDVRASDQRSLTVELDGGQVLEADALVIGIGVSPNVELAAGAGLEVADGIVVDDTLLTDDPAISAIGDCARFPCAITSRSLRLESIQNATDQARHVADRVMGGALGYEAVPWFWSDQHGVKLQIAGVGGPGDRTVPRGDPASGSYSICRFDGDRLVAVESIDRPGDHLAARRLLRDGSTVGPTEIADDSVPLKALAGV